MQVKLN